MCNFLNFDGKEIKYNNVYATGLAWRGKKGTDENAARQMYGQPR